MRYKVARDVVGDLRAHRAFLARPAVELAEAAIGGAVAVVLLAIAGYVFGSFLLMGRHVGARHVGATTGRTHRAGQPSPNCSTSAP